MVIATALLCLASAALVLAAVQTVALRQHLRGRSGEPRSFPAISILKPLCGVDDDLWANLTSFVELDYPDYEILLGVKDARDPAHRFARRAAERWPRLVRVVLQGGSPGLNPKVNQLIALSAAARGEVLVVSDSNTRVRRNYLRGIAAAFDDAQVGLVTHPVAGVGEETLGALFDNLTLCGSIAAGVVSAKRLAGKDLVVGKSMAVRRADLRAMGGFERLKDVLAEDFLSGRIITRELGKRVALAVDPVFNVSRSQCVPAFFCRYLRWSVMQRKIVGNAAYSTQILLNPVALAFAALLASPDRRTATVLCGMWLSRSALHQGAALALRGRGYSAACLLAPVSDLILAGAWAAGLVRAEINWRGNRLAVRAGTRLERVDAVNKTKRRAHAASISGSYPPARSRSPRREPMELVSWKWMPFALATCALSTAALAQGHRRAPPPEAYTACASKAQGDACSVQIRDRAINGLCAADGAQKLFCAHDRAAPGGPHGPPPEGSPPTPGQ